MSGRRIEGRLEAGTWGRSSVGMDRKEEVCEFNVSRSVSEVQGRAAEGAWLRADMNTAKVAERTQVTSTKARAGLTVRPRVGLRLQRRPMCSSPGGITGALTTLEDDLVTLGVLDGAVEGIVEAVRDTVVRLEVEVDDDGTGVREVVAAVDFVRVERETAAGVFDGTTGPLISTMGGMVLRWCGIAGSGRGRV